MIESPNNTSGEDKINRNVDNNGTDSDSYSSGSEISLSQLMKQSSKRRQNIYSTDSDSKNNN